MEQGFLGLIADNMVFFWIIVAIIFAVIEGITCSMVTIMFTIGAVPSVFVALFDGSIVIQIVVFLVVSLLLLIFARPIFVKKLNVGKEKNVTEQLEGKLAIVTEEIAPFKSGLVKVGGIIWTAIGIDNNYSAAVGEQVEIVRVEGVKLIVTKPNLSSPE